MTYIPVSTGIPALVRRKRSHVVSLIDERKIEFFRRIPYVILFVGAVIANLTFVGAGPFEALRSHYGYSLIATGTVLVLATVMLMSGRRVRFEKSRMEADVVFLPEWTYAMLLSVAAALILMLT
jgi:hypothetical protein